MIRRRDKQPITSLIPTKEDKLFGWLIERWVTGRSRHRQPTNSLIPMEEAQLFGDSKLRGDWMVFRFREAWSLGANPILIVNEC